MENIDHYAELVSEMLITKTYEPRPYRIKKIFDGANKKERVIYEPAFFPDQIVHWALMLQIEHTLMRGMYKYSCGSIPGRGTSYAQKTLRKWLDNDPKNTKYCFKMDISKFYPSINNDILKEMFRTKIKDRDCLWLIDTIIDTADGMPIGNYTSQWFSNFYLEGLDHFIKEKLGVKYYIRYVDDLIILGSNKRKLHRMRFGIEEYLAGIDLKIKDNWQVFNVDKRPIDFLGFKFYRTYTTLRKRNALRMRRRWKKIGDKPYLNYRDACAIISAWGWVKRSNSYNFYQKYSTVSLKKAKRTVSRYDKAKNLRRNTRLRPGEASCVPA